MPETKLQLRYFMCLWRSQNQTNKHKHIIFTSSLDLRRLAPLARRLRRLRLSAQLHRSVAEVLPGTEDVKETWIGGESQNYQSMLLTSDGLQPTSYATYIVAKFTPCYAQGRHRQ